MAVLSVKKPGLRLRLEKQLEELKEIQGEQLEQLENEMTDGWLERYIESFSEVTGNLAKGLGLFLKREKKE